MIGACAVLHNIAILYEEPVCGDPEADDQPDPICCCGPEDGKAIRDHMCNRFFWHFSWSRFPKKTSFVGLLQSMDFNNLI